MTSPNLPPQTAPGHHTPVTATSTGSTAWAPQLPAQPQPGPPPGGQPYPVQTVPGRSRVDRGAQVRRLAGWVSLGGAAVVALGSVLPWASVMLVGPIYGTEGDGVITLGVAVLVAVLALLAGLGRGRTWMFAVTLFLGLLATAIAAYDLSNISSLVSGESMASVGPGLPVIIVGGLAVMGAALFAIVRGRR